MEGFRRYFEAMTYGYFGPLTEIIGDGEPQRLSYGTAEEWAGQPMLYVPLRPRQGGSGWSAVLNSIRRKLSKQGINCVPDPSAFNGYKCTSSGGYGKSYVMHTGESHVTIAMHNLLNQNYQQICEKVGVPEGTSLQDAMLHARMKDGRYLFETAHQGVECPVKPAGDVIFGVAKSYEGEPIVCLLPVQCPMYGAVREALGLPAPPSNYAVHATVGYVYPADVQNRNGNRLKTTDRQFQSQLPPPSTRQHDQSFLAKNGARYAQPEIQRGPETY